MKILHRYILKEILPAFLISLGFIIFIILMNELFYLAEIFLTKDVPLSVALQVLLYLLPSVVALALPLAFMAGVLGGLGRLAAEREIEALGILGFTPSSLLKPLFSFGLVLAIVCLSFTLWLTPTANYHWLQTMVNSVLNQVRLNIEPGRFVESIPGRVIFVQKKLTDGRWQQVFLYQPKESGKAELVLARSAFLKIEPGQQEAWIELQNGRSYELDMDNPEALSLIEFKRSEQSLDLNKLRNSFSLEKKSREKNIGELWRDWQRLKEKNRSTQEGRLILLEIHKRFSLPATCLLFVFLGAGLGWRRWPGGRLAGYGVGLIIILIYYFLLVSGEQRSVRGNLAPWVAMWLPNFFVLFFGIYFYFSSFKRNYVLGSLKFFGLGKFISKAGNPRQRNQASPAQKKRVASFPSLLDRYVFSRFFRLLIMIFLAILIIMMAITFLQRLELVRENQRPVKELWSFIWYKIPEFVLLGFLVSTLIAVSLSLSFLGRRKEILAFLSSGISYFRAVRSLLIFGLILIPLIFIFQDRSLSRSNFKAEEIWSTISERPVRTFSYLNRYWLRAKENGAFYHYELLDPNRRLVQRLLIMEPIENRSELNRIIFAREAVIENGQLILKEGWERFFWADGSQLNRFSQKPFEMKGAESYLLREWKEPAHMNLSELKRYALDLEASGMPATRFRLESEFRKAFSASLLVFILMACGAAGFLGHKGFLWPLTASLITGFIYWQVLALFRSLGLSEALSPFLSAWSPQIIFLLLGTYFLLKGRT